MHYPVDSADQLRRVLHSLRQSRHLTHAALAEKLGASHQHVASVEAAPESANLDDLARLLEAMGCRLTIEEIEPPTPLTRPGTTTRHPLHEVGA